MEVFHHGEEFYRSLRGAIAGAKEEILVNVYTFQNDEVGGRLIELLVRKLKEGVRVRVILDGVGSRDDGREVAKAIVRHGGAVKIFRPRGRFLFRHPLAFARRNHARIFLVDRRLVGLGGMCIGDIYRTRRDLSVLIHDARAADIVSYFDLLWDRAEAHRDDMPPFELPQAATLADGVTALVSGPRKEEQMIHGWFLAKIRQARRRIVIVSTWFLPAGELVDSLIAADARGVRVTIVTPIHTDKRWYDEFRGGAAARLLRGNVAWYGGRDYFHQKFALIDDHWCLGSANFDMISMNRNYELNICGEGGEMLPRLEESVVQAVTGAERITRANLPWFVKSAAGIFYPVLEMFVRV